LAGGDGADGAEAVGEGESLGMVEGEAGFWRGAAATGRPMGTAKGTRILSSWLFASLTLRVGVQAAPAGRVVRARKAAMKEIVGRMSGSF